MSLSLSPLEPVTYCRLLPFLRHPQPGRVPGHLASHHHPLHALWRLLPEQRVCIRYCKGFDANIDTYLQICVMLSITLNLIFLAKGFRHVASWLINVFPIRILASYLSFSLIHIREHSSFCRLITIHSADIQKHCFRYRLTTAYFGWETRNLFLYMLITVHFGWDTRNLFLLWIDYSTFWFRYEKPISSIDWSQHIFAEIREIIPS
jgi:hypothetical protein